MDNSKLLITVTYTLANGRAVEINVPFDVAKALEEMDRHTQSQGRADRRYLDKAGFLEREAEAATSLYREDISEIVDRLDESARLHQAMKNLSLIQQRRIHQYFYEGLNYRQIARIEGVSEAAIRRSVKAALEKTKNYF